MDKEMAQQLIASGSAALTALAEAAKTTGEHLYGILVRQQTVEGIGSLVAWGSYLLVVALLVKLLYPKAKQVVEPGSSEDAFFLILLFIVGLILLFIAWGNMQDAFQHILNPEYYALKFLIESVKK
jgi:hypothetical protein